MLPCNTGAMSIWSCWGVQVGKLSTKTRPCVDSQRLHPLCRHFRDPHPSQHLSNYLHSHELPEAEWYGAPGPPGDFQLPSHLYCCWQRPQHHCTSPLVWRADMPLDFLANRSMKQQQCLPYGAYVGTHSHFHWCLDCQLLSLAAAVYFQQCAVSLLSMESQIHLQHFGGPFPSISHLMGVGKAPVLFPH